MEDASSLAAISLEVWLNTYMHNGINAFFAEYVLSHFTVSHFREILRSEHETIWVSQNIVGIDGFIRVSSQSVPPLDGCSNLDISSLYVQPRHQTHGIGKRLLQTALDFCATTGLSNVWLAVNAENEKAINFYMRNNFVKVGETDFLIGKKAYLNYIFFFQLGRC